MAVSTGCTVSDDLAICLYGNRIVLKTTQTHTHSVCSLNTLTLHASWDRTNKAGRFEIPTQWYYYIWKEGKHTCPSTFHIDSFEYLQNILDSHIVSVLVNWLTEWVPIGPTRLNKKDLLTRYYMATSTDYSLRQLSVLIFCHPICLSMNWMDNCSVCKCIKQLEQQKLSWSIDGVFSIQICINYSESLQLQALIHHYGNHSLLSRFTYEGSRTRGHYTKMA